jgi:hypothetical protein
MIPTFPTVAGLRPMQMVSGPERLTGAEAGRREIGLRPAMQYWRGCYISYGC